MNRRTSRFLGRTLVPALVLFVFVVPAFSQADPDPNSPEPVLLSVENAASSRVLTRNSKRTILSTVKPTAFQAESTVQLLVTNLSLSKDEDQTAIRVYAQDAKGHLFRFPVVNLRTSDKDPAVYVLTVVLKDELKFWDQPSLDADLAIRVSWRGMGSNARTLGNVPLAGDEKIQLPGKKEGAPGDDGENYIGYRWSGDRMRFMEQATFGPSPMLDARLRRIGIRTWLVEQFDAQYPSPNNPFPNHPLKPGTAPSDCDGNTTIPDVPATCARDTYSMYQPQTWFFREAFYGDAQLRHRVAWALSQVWVTSGVDIQQGRHMVEYYKVLSRNAFGNYRTLMKEMTLHPTMGDYLDMVRSTKNNPNENYARELMQLFTVGLFQLNQDGTLQRDAEGDPIPTYDQNNVNNLTKVLTGWNFCQNAALCPNLTAGTVNFIDPLLLNTNNHDVTAKTLLAYPGSSTTNIAACSGCNSAAIATYANDSLEQALDNIYNHPNVAPFVSKILIQHLVTSDPTPAYVARISGVFNTHRSSPTQMKEVIRAILLDPEARGDVKTDPNYGKLREPVQLATNLLRTFSVRSADGLSLSDGFMTGRAEFNGMAQSPLRSPTVFNYYPPDYVIPGTAMPGPEFALMTTGTSIQRANFMNRFVFTAIPIAVALPDAPNGTSIDFSDLQSLVVADPTNNLLLDALNQRMLHGTMSASM